ncbi:GNAT family N-acetyltransferase [Flavobacterium sp. F-65]|jgi:ribosomal protein S18 acetylase RimI-like enzyme|uniref:GNAT family N-acetyltransferase n=1 Tax=Flavobacterium pisciphilum TaxID=2893755 RepID=A0ABS8MP75_9FLAO|nr:GNAT family N-acetyltransferase [Flavobacterium sp. F-65]MCC9070546.1 GNAT family N-acetyltransferase [Flavobacterium sp. F-65]
MEINTLEKVEIDSIVEVLNASFSDYIVPLQLNSEQLKAKIVAENIKLDLSIGVFSSDKLVGFMLHAVNEFDGQLIAYNAATGVIPDYRGQGLVTKMYDYLLPKLKDLGVKEMVLEVIVGNNAAIRAYEKMNYKIHRTVNCYGGPIEITNQKSIATIKELEDFQWNTFTSFWSIEPTWQNTIKSLDNSKERCCILEAYIKNEPVGYMVYNRMTQRILQIAVAANHRRNGVGAQLVNKMLETINSKEVSMNNVDDNSLETNAFLKNLGLLNKVSQFEMKRKI